MALGGIAFQGEKIDATGALGALAREKAAGEGILADRIAQKDRVDLAREQMKREDEQSNRDRQMQGKIAGAKIGTELRQQDIDRYLEEAKMELDANGEEADRYSKLSMLGQKMAADRMEKSREEAEAKNALAKAGDDKILEELETYNTDLGLIDEGLKAAEVLGSAAGAGIDWRVKLGRAGALGRSMSGLSKEQMEAYAKLDQIATTFTLNKAALLSGPKSDKDIELLEKTNFNASMTIGEIREVGAAMQRRMKAVIAKRKSKLSNYGRGVQAAGGYGTITSEETGRTMSIGNVPEEQQAPPQQPSQVQTPQQGGGMYDDLIPQR
jgi:hypothetical protein